MKYKLTKAEFEALTEDQQKEYTLTGEDAVLKIEGDGAPTLEAVTRAEDKLRIEKDHRKNAETARDAAEAASEKLRTDLEKADGKGDREKLIATHKAEIEEIRAERVAEQTAAKAKDSAAMIKEVSEKFANDHFTTPSLLASPFGDRLSVEEIEGTQVIRVKGADGKASALSLDELKKEFLDNKEFSAIIKANPGSGGGALPGGGGGASLKKLSEMTATEEAEFERTDPAGYTAASSSDK